MKGPRTSSVESFSEVLKDLPQTPVSNVVIEPVGGLAITPQVVQFVASTGLPEDSYSVAVARGLPTTISRGPRRVVSVSESTRRPHRRALLVGATYFGSSSIHHFPSNVKHLQGLFDLLTRRLGYRKENICVLTDMPRQVVGATMHKVPTRDNLLAAMSWLVDNSGEGDKLFFCFSGLSREAQKNAKTGKWVEECLLPSDYPMASSIPQLQVADRLLRHLHPKATLTAILDCNRSHPVIRLPYILVSHRESRKKHRIKHTYQYTEALPAIMQRVTIGAMLLFRGLRNDVIEARRENAEIEQKKLAMWTGKRGKVVAFGGCANHLDVTDGEWLKPMPTGALTWALVDEITQSIDNKKSMTFRSLLSGISPVVCKKRHSQMVQITMSHQIHLDTPVFFSL